MKTKYDFSEKGINEVIEDYINANWRVLNFTGIDKNEMLDLEYVDVFVQKAFSGNGYYEFRGDVRPRISDNEGGYNVDTYRITGYASIAIDSSTTFKCSIDDNISMTKK